MIMEMKSRAIVATALALMGSTPAVWGYNATNPPVGCYNDTTPVWDEIAMGEGSGIYPKKYILCPNQVYNLGTRSMIDGSCCVNGMRFLVVKSKTTIQCGEDGKSENNCIIRGGDTQLAMGPGGLFELRVTDVVIKGLTFEQPAQSFFAGVAEGDIIFEDCRFRNSKAPSPILMMFMPIPDPIFNPPGDDILVVKFNNSVFENLTQTRADAGLEVDGIVTTFYPEWSSVSFNRCIFRNNYFPGFEDNPDSYAIKSVGTPISVYNSCFYNNTWAGWGPIRGYNGSKVEAGNNFMAAQWGRTPCSFIIKTDKISPDYLKDIACIDADVQECPVDGRKKEDFAAIEALIHRTNQEELALSDMDKNPTSFASNQFGQSVLPILSLAVLFSIIVI